MIAIRAATAKDHDAVWAFLESVIRAGETYALNRDMDKRAALAYWFGKDRSSFVAEDAGEIVGSYFLRANAAGGGGHVANCGYVTKATAQGRGIARAMCTHSVAEAKALGFRAMQFNFVISTNARAVALWIALGFAEVGRLPGAFAHPEYGDVDSLVMYRTF